MKRFKRSCCGDCQSYDFTYTGSKMDDDVVVDKTRFKPSLVRNDFGQRVDGLGGVPQYHFNDGVDNGYTLSSIDSISPDITEIDSSMKIFQNRIDEQYKKVDEEFKKEVEDLKNVVEKTSKTSEVINSFTSSSSNTQ